MARANPDVWRLHSDLVAVNLDLLHHARRRVRVLRPTKDGRFEFARSNEGEDELGRTVFDLFVRYTQGEQEP